MYWSSTTYSPDPANAWYVYFNYGYTNAVNKSNGFHVRLVRSGQSFDTLDAQDGDGDGVANSTDNCPITSNADQADLDSDGIGDVCDGDDDGDGVADVSDNCPIASNADQADLDSDGMGDACDPAFSVTPSSGGNGTIAPGTVQTVDQGDTTSFTLTPDAGYHTDSVDGTCGGNLAGDTFTTTAAVAAAVTADCTVEANFVIDGVTSYSAPSATGTGNITASFTGGGAGCGYTVSQYIPLSGNAASPPAGSAPAGVSFPHGLFDFTTGGCVAGSTITMTVTYPQALPAGTQYWEYGPTPTAAAPHWYVLTATIDGNTATFSITDGDLGDDDLVANGTIVDQGGPGAGAASAIPTLSEWGMLLAGMLVMLGAVGMRRGRG